MRTENNNFQSSNDHGVADNNNVDVHGSSGHLNQHHTAHTMGNGASSSNSGAHGGGTAATTRDNGVPPSPAVDALKLSVDGLLGNQGEGHGPVNEDLSSPSSPTSSILESDSDEGNLTDATSMCSSGNLANFSLIDTTLREGEQFATADFTTEMKIEIAKALDALGVEYIEVTSPAASERSRDDCAALCKLGLKAKILCHIRCNMDDARIAVATGVDGINMCIGTSSQLMAHSHGKDMNWIAAKAKEVIEFVQANNVEVRFSGEDSFRSDFNEIIKLYTLVDSLGANRIGIADTVGGATPMGVYHKVGALRRALSCDMETHFHNDTGCAVANALCALEAGATHIDVTVLGIGERNGITPLGKLLSALMHTQRDYILRKYNLEKLRELEQMVAKMTKVEIPWNSPIIKA